MVFSSLTFLYFFLPIALTGYLLVPKAVRNAWLLLVSMVFYLAGEHGYVVMLIWVFAFNWAAGLVIERARSERGRRWAVGGAIACNLALLLFYKYANFLVGAMNVPLAALGLAPIHLAPVHLPIGISFFVFQAVSYVVDVYRRDVQASRSLLDYGMYKALFPQLIAGPIVRYKDVAHEIYARQVTVEDFASGAQRFIVGLGKKVLIANIVAAPADHIFSLKGDEVTAGLAWLGTLCYGLQIYFDFSGYSDMAIGLGRMFGFHFLENFNLPYVSQSVGEFWRRWHISLSTWFRDYLYIPLGGSRCSAMRTTANLFVVFALCGLWHGAAWTFMLWGVYHGCFLAAEHWGCSQVVARLWWPLRHVYCLLAVGVGWVLFRAESLSQAMAMLKAMAGMGVQRDVSGTWTAVGTGEVWVVIVIGLFGSVGAGAWIAAAWRRLDGRWCWPAQVLRIGVLGLVMIGSSAALTASSYNPFIYFRF